MPRKRHASNAISAAVFAGVIATFAVGAALTACSESTTVSTADDPDLDLWASAAHRLARHPAVGTWRTNDHPGRPSLIVKLNHDRTGTITARTSPEATPTVYTVRWRPTSATDISVHRDLGPFASNTPAIRATVRGRDLQVKRYGAGLRAAHMLVRSTGNSAVANAPTR